MKKEDEWYKNRILWKAGKNYLFDFNCLKFDDLENDVKNCLQKRIPKTEIPVIAFFENYNKWTVLCTRCLCSYHDGVFYCIKKDDLTQKITPHIKKDSAPIDDNLEKRDAKWLKMNDTGEYIWLPSSDDLWNFWGVLKMLGKLRVPIE